MKQCLKCNSITTGRYVRGFCVPCYTIELRAGNLNKVYQTSKTGYCKVCLHPTTRVVRGMCFTCYHGRKFITKDGHKLCRTCRNILKEDENIVCQNCLQSKVDIEISEYHLKKSKLILTKAKWNLLTTIDIFMIIHLWDLYFKKSNRGIDTLDIEDQLLIMLKDIKKGIDSEYIVYGQGTQN